MYTSGALYYVDLGLQAYCLKRLNYRPIYRQNRILAKMFLHKDIVFKV